MYLQEFFFQHLYYTYPNFDRNRLLTFWNGGSDIMMRGMGTSATFFVFAQKA